MDGPLPIWLTYHVCKYGAELGYMKCRSPKCKNQIGDTNKKYLKHDYNTKKTRRVV